MQSSRVRTACSLLFVGFVVSACAVGIVACGPDGGALDGSLSQPDAATVQDGAVSGGPDGPPGTPGICRINATWPAPDGQGIVAPGQNVERVGSTFYRFGIPAGSPPVPVWGKLSNDGARPDTL